MYESEAGVRMWAFTSCAITLFPDVCFYKMERCSNTMFRKKALYSIDSVFFSVKSLFTLLNFILNNIFSFYN
jgi:hypothetical protein